MDELQQFCASRKIPFPKVPSGKAELILVLENADDNPHFEGFSELPAELRVRIYEFHFESAYERGTFLGPPGQAPITRVSRLLRKESLPVFYDVVRFPFSTYPLSSSGHSMSRHGMKDDKYKKKATRKFIDQAPEAIVSEIKKLSIDGWVLSPEASFSRYYWLWEIDLADKGRNFSLWCEEIPRSTLRYLPWSKPEQGEIQAQHDQAEKMFRAILDKMAVRDGEMRLTKKDLKALTGVLRRVTW